MKIIYGLTVTFLYLILVVLYVDSSHESSVTETQLNYLADLSSVSIEMNMSLNNGDKTRESLVKDLLYSSEKIAESTEGNSQNDISFLKTKYQKIKNILSVLPNTKDKFLSENPRSAIPAASNKLGEVIFEAFMIKDNDDGKEIFLYQNGQLNGYFVRDKEGNGFNLYLDRSQKPLYLPINKNEQPYLITIDNKAKKIYFTYSYNEGKGSCIDTFDIKFNKIKHETMENMPIGFVPGVGYTTTVIKLLKQ